MGGWLSSAISDRMLAVSGSASLALLDGGSWLAFPACGNKSAFPPSSRTRRFRGRWKRREYGFGTASNAFNSPGCLYSIESAKERLFITTERIDLLFSADSV
nr:hypothetical protein Q903MT_gene1711 [Picea sitchensis]